MFDNSSTEIQNSTHTQKVIPIFQSSHIFWYFNFLILIYIYIFIIRHGKIYKKTRSVKNERCVFHFKKWAFRGIIYCSIHHRGSSQSDDPGERGYESARSGACAWQRINLYLENYVTCYLELWYTRILKKRRLLKKKSNQSVTFWKKFTFIFLIEIFFSSYCWKIEEKFQLLCLETFFILRIFIEIQVCKNKRISVCLKFLNISRKIMLKKYVSFFLSNHTKKSFIRIYVCNENLKNNDSVFFFFDRVLFYYVISIRLSMLIVKTNIHQRKMLKKFTPLLTNEWFKEK